MKATRKLMGIVLSLIMIISMFVPMATAEVGIDGPHFVHEGLNVFATIDGNKVQYNDADLYGEDGNNLTLEFVAAMEDPVDTTVHFVPQPLNVEIGLNIKNKNGEVEGRTVQLSNLTPASTDANNFSQYTADFKIFENIENAYDCVVEISRIHIAHDNGANDVLAGNSWVAAYNANNSTNSYNVQMIEIGNDVPDTSASVTGQRNVTSLYEIIEAIKAVNGCTFEEDARWTVVKDGVEFESYHTNELVFLENLVSSNGTIVLKPFVGFTGELSLLSIGNFNLFIDNEEKTPVQGDILLVGDDDGRHLKYNVSAAMSTTNWVNGEPVSHSIDKDIVTTLESNIEIKFIYEDDSEETKSYKSSLNLIGKDTNEEGTTNWNQFEGTIDLFENETPEDAIIEFTKVDFGANVNDSIDWSAAKGDELWIFGYAKDNTRYDYKVNMINIENDVDPSMTDITINVNGLTSVNTLRQIIERFDAAALNGYEFPENTSWLVLDENGNEVGYFGTDEWLILNSYVYSGEITLMPYYNDGGNNDDPNIPIPPAGSFPVNFVVDFYRDGLVEGPQTEEYTLHTDGTETFEQLLERLKEEHIGEFNKYGLAFKEFEFLGTPPTLTDKPTGEMGMSVRVEYENNFGMAEISFYMEDGTNYTERLNEAIIKDNLTYQDILDNVQDIVNMLEGEAIKYEGFTGWRYESFGEEVKPEDLGKLVTTYGETDQHTLNIIASYEKSPEVKVVYYTKDENDFGVRNEAYFPANDGDSFDSIVSNIKIEEGTGWAYAPDIRTKTYGSHVTEIIAVREYSGYTSCFVNLTYVKNDEDNEERFIGTTDPLVVYVNKTGLDGETLKPDVADMAEAYDAAVGMSTSKFTKKDYRAEGTYGLDIPGINQALGFHVAAQYEEHLVILYYPDFTEEYIITDLTQSTTVKLDTTFGDKEIVWKGQNKSDANGNYDLHVDGVWTDAMATYTDGSQTVVFEYDYNDEHYREAVIFSAQDWEKYGNDPQAIDEYFDVNIFSKLEFAQGEEVRFEGNHNFMDQRGSLVYMEFHYEGEGEGPEPEYRPSFKGEIEFYPEEDLRVIENFVLGIEELSTVEELVDLVNSAIPHAEGYTFEGWKIYLTDGNAYVEITPDLYAEAITEDIEGLTFQFTALYAEKEYCEHDYKAVEGTAPTLTKPGIREHFKCSKCGAMYYEEPMHGAEWFNEKRSANDTAELETSPLQLMVIYSYVNGEGKPEIGSALMPTDGSRAIHDIFSEVIGNLDHYEEYTPYGWKIIIGDEEAIITEDNMDDFQDFFDLRLTEETAGMDICIKLLYEEEEVCDCFYYFEGVEGKEPTVSEDGHLEYLVCSECGLKVYITEESIPGFNKFITFEDMDEIKINKLVTIVPNEDGKAEAKVEDTLIDNAINETLESGETQIVIGVLPEEETEEKVTSVTLSKEAIEQIIEANENTEEELTVVIPLDDVIVVFDMETMKAVNEGEGEKTLNIEVKKTADELNEKQKEALNGKKTHSLVTATWVDENGEKISNFNGGSVVAILPEFKAEEGKELKDYIVLYISDEGKFERMPTAVKDGMLTFETSHFSDYIVVSLEDADVLAPETNNDDTQGGNGENDSGEDGKEDDKTENDKDVPNTGDETNLAFYVAVLLISAMALAVASKKRRYN